MKTLIIAMLLISTPAMADVAVWTGKFDLVSESPYSNTWDCEYIYEGERFWRLQNSYCETKIEAKYIEE